MFCSNTLTHYEINLALPEIFVNFVFKHVHAARIYSLDNLFH